VSAVNQDGSVLIPLYSQLYSHRKETIGENGQILTAISPEIILEPELGLVNRNQFDDLLRFIYYKLALTIKKILVFARFYSPPSHLSLPNVQLAIPFKEWI